MKEVVVAVVVRQGDKVLLVQQRKPSSHGLWSYPGGHVEEGESLKQALQREVREELDAGLGQASLLRVERYKNREGNDFEHHAFVGSIEGGITIPEDELMGYGWFTLPALTDMKKQLRAPFVLELAREVLGYTHATE